MTIVGNHTLTLGQGLLIATIAAMVPACVFLSPLKNVNGGVVGVLLFNHSDTDLKGEDIPAASPRTLYSSPFSVHVGGQLKSETALPNWYWSEEVSCPPLVERPLAPRRLSLCLHEWNVLAIASVCEVDALDDT